MSTTEPSPATTPSATTEPTEPTEPTGPIGTTIALVTGANKGLGYETARQLAALGWTVYVGARDEARGAEAAAKLAADGADARFVALDVTSDESVDAAAVRVEGEAGRLDVLVNNAGIVGGRPQPPDAPVFAGVPSALDTLPEDFLACFGTNLLGPVRVTHAFLPLLRRAELPRVVMVSSGMGSITATGDPERLESAFVSLVYPASKAALNMVMSMYARSLPGWKVNAADPGYTATDLNGHTGTQPVEVGAGPIVRLATLGPDGPTGTFLGVDGPMPW
jgi:NAD(P)-dependent dehydrogenase (short-subunit alcohol dehydrogenase family)